MDTDKLSGKSILFMMIFPLLTALVGSLFFGVFLPIFFAFVLTKVTHKPYRVFVTALTFLLTLIVFMVSINLFISSKWISLGIAAFTVTMYFLCGFMYQRIGRRGFWLGVLSGAGVFVAGWLLFFAVIFFAGGYNISESLINFLTAYFNTDAAAELSRMVIAFSNALNSDTAQSVADTTKIFNAAMALDPNTAIKQFTVIVTPVISNILPGILLIFSFFTGLCTGLFSSLFGRIKAFDGLEGLGWRKSDQSPSVIPLYALVYPKRLLSGAVVAFITVYLLVLGGVLNGTAYLYTIGIFVFFLYTILGMCFTDFILKVYKLHWSLRALILFVLFIFTSGSLLGIVGLIDAITGIRRRYLILGKGKMS